MKKKPHPKLENTNIYWYLFKRDTLLATIFVFLVIGLFLKIEKRLGIFDPKDATSKDFEYTDLAFNLLNKYNSHPFDKGICIVNVGNSDLKTIADVVNKVSRAKPKVIGIDILFGLVDTPRKQDIQLRDMIHNNKLIVSAYELDAASMPTPGYFADSMCKSGFVNFTVENQNVIRDFVPYLVKKDTLLSFATACVKSADPQKYTTLLARHRKVETINYTRTEDKFQIINIDSAEDFSSVNDKIVLIGVINSGFNYEDKHFTPLNTKLTGKSPPDMNGIMIHANMIRMMLDDNYIHASGGWLKWCIAFIICWLHMAFFISYFIEKHIWFHLASKLIQLVSAVVFIYFSLFLFYDFDIQIDMTPTIVAIILAVDVLYFYEAGVVWFHQKKGYKTLFHHDYAN